MSNIIRRNEDIKDLQDVCTIHELPLTLISLYSVIYECDKTQTGSFKPLIGTKAYYPMMEERHNRIMENLNCIVENEIDQKYNWDTQRIWNGKDYVNIPIRRKKVITTDDDLIQRMADFAVFYKEDGEYTYDNNAIYQDKVKILEYDQGVPRKWMIQPNVHKIEDKLIDKYVKDTRSQK